MMIYFDKNKQAYGDEIDNPLCVVDDSEWQKFCTLVLGEDYDVTSEGIVDLHETEEWKRKEAQRQRLIKIAEIKYALSELDLRSIRPARAGETERLAELEAQAQKLREELRALGDIA